MNYIDNTSIYGLMNKNCVLCNVFPYSFYKSKKLNKLTICNTFQDPTYVFDVMKDVNEINYMYIEIEDNIENISNIIHNGKLYTIPQITSLIDSSYSRSNIRRCKHEELYESIKKYENLVNVIKLDEYIDIARNKELSLSLKNQIIDMIEKWRYQDKGGMKYKWREHAGIDKNIINTYFKYDLYAEPICYDTNIYIVVNKHPIGKDDIILGYACIAASPNSMIKNDATNEMILQYNYLTRKCLYGNIIDSNNKKYSLRNLTLYLDWYVFNDLMIDIKNIYDNDKFIVNWGCSTDGVYDYKTKKWPLYKIEQKLFGKINRL